MKRFSILAIVAGALFFAASAVQAAPCMIVTLTGTQSGPHRLGEHPPRREITLGETSGTDHGYLNYKLRVSHT